MTLAAIRERLEAATGPDREVDADLWWRFDERGSEDYFNRASMGLPQKRDHSKPMPVGLGRCGVRAMAPAYTASVDAALGLIERALPGWGGDVGFGPPDGCFARIWPNSAEGCIPEYSGDGPTPALALIYALLAALDNKGDPR